MSVENLHPNPPVDWDKRPLLRTASDADIHEAYKKGCTIAELARFLELPEGDVRGAIHRALMAGRDV